MVSLAYLCVAVPSWLADGRKVNGWLGEKALLGKNELAGFRNAQQVFLSLMEDNDFPRPLHEVSRRDALPLRTQPG